MDKEEKVFVVMYKGEPLAVIKPIGGIYHSPTILNRFAKKYDLNETERIHLSLDLVLVVTQQSLLEE